MVGRVCLTDRASAAATAQHAHNPTFLKTEAAASCMRLLGRCQCTAVLGTCCKQNQAGNRQSVTLQEEPPCPIYEVVRFRLVELTAPPCWHEEEGGAGLVSYPKHLELPIYIPV